MKERQTISAVKLFSNNSVEEYGTFLNSILVSNGVDVIEMAWNPEKERFMCIIKMDMTENSLATMFINKEIRFIDKSEYMEITSKSNTRFLV